MKQPINIPPEWLAKIKHCPPATASGLFHYELDVLEVKGGAGVVSLFPNKKPKSYKTQK